ncbi:MAG: type II secretion system protein [Fimbriimonadales bacterium]
MLNRSKLEKYRKPDGAFTLVELMVVVAIVGLLAALLFPVFARVKRSAQEIASLSNMRQMGLALSMYAADHEGWFPTVKENLADPTMTTWVDEVQPYVKARLLRRSPLDDSPAWGDLTNPRLTSYGLNAYFDFRHPPYFGCSLDETVRPSETVVVAELRVTLLGSDFLVRGDHFHPQYYGNPSRVSNARFQPLQWDPVRRLPRMTLLDERTLVGPYIFADGHAARVPWPKLWKQRDGAAPERDRLDPRRAEDQT